MTLKRFYSWVKSECKEKRRTASPYKIPLRRRRATRRLLRQRSDPIHCTHLTHTGNPCLPKMQIQFSRQGKRADTYGDLCQPRLSVSAPANRLVLCDRVNSCSGAEARWPGRYAPPICCSDSAVSPNSAWNLMSIFLPSVCTDLSFDSRFKVITYASQTTATLWLPVLHGWSWLDDAKDISWPPIITKEIWVFVLYFLMMQPDLRNHLF